MYLMVTQENEWELWNVCILDRYYFFVLPLLRRIWSSSSSSSSLSSVAWMCFMALVTKIYGINKLEENVVIRFFRWVERRSTTKQNRQEREKNVPSPSTSFILQARQWMIKNGTNSLKICKSREYRYVVISASSKVQFTFLEYKIINKLMKNINIFLRCHVMFYGEWWLGLVLIAHIDQFRNDKISETKF